MSKITDCPNVQFYVDKEIAKIQQAITRIVQGLDPSSALSAMKDAVASDLAENAAKVSKAAAEGIGSEFTQQLIKGVLDQVLNEVISSLPPGDAKTVAQKVQSLTEINFSMIQLALQLADTSPLVMASKAKKAFFEAVDERSDEIAKTISLCKQLRQIVNSADSATSKASTIAAKVEKSYTEASDKLTAADAALLKVQAGILKKVVDKNNLDSAKSLLLEALQILSPLDMQIGANAITNNSELIGLLQANVSDADIVQKILASSGVNSFSFEEESLLELRLEGMSSYVERMFLSIKNFPKSQDPAQVVWKKAKDKISEINKQIQKLDTYEISIPNILNNYLTIKSAMEEPKAQDIHAGPMYDRVIVRCRTTVSKIINRMKTSSAFIASGVRPGSSEFTTESVGSWIAEISVVLSLLDVVQQGMYEEKKLNANPLNSQFYKAYENSFKSFSESPKEWTVETKRKSNLSFSSGIDVIALIAGGAHAVLVSKSPEDIKRRLADMDSNIKILSGLVVIKESNETDASTHLNKYSPEPEVPDIFDKLFDMVKKLGFDRVYDELVNGGLVNVLNMPPELSTYIGAAAACLREKASQASNEFERRKFEKASLKLSKQNKSRFLGKVNMSMRSVQAVKNLKARIEEILALVKSLFEQDIITSDNTLTDGVFTSLPNL